MTPDETAPAFEVVATAQYAGMGRPQPRFADAVLDPDLFLVVQQGARRRTQLGAASRQERIERALLGGPDALTPAERRAVLGDAEALATLYRAVRSAPVHPGWTMARGAASRATIHHMGERRPTRHGTPRTLVRPG
jgi:membrane glycosyltransferase